jgi:phosphinothricin acetyltransferase
MARLQEVARAADVHVLVAGVSGENLVAIAFHRAIGFAEVARMPEVGRKFGRWMDLVLLQKAL